MQNTIALLDSLAQCFHGHPNGVTPHLVIQMTLWKKGIIQEIAHGIHDLENLVS